MVIQILKEGEEEEGAEVEAEEEGEEGEEAGEEDEAESRIYYTRLISSRNEISIYQRNEMKEKEHFQNAKNLLTRRKPNAPAKKDFKEDSGPQEENHFTLSKTGDIVSKEEKSKFHNSKKKEDKVQESYKAKEEFKEDKRNYREKRDRRDNCKNVKNYDDRDNRDYEDEEYHDDYHQGDYRRKPRRGRGRKHYNNRPVYVKKGENQNEEKEDMGRNTKPTYKKKKPKYKKVEKKNDNEGSNPYFKKNLFDVLSKD